MNKNSDFFTRIPKAIGYSLEGLKASWQTEASFRQEVLMLIVLLPLALWLGDNGIERALLIGCLLIVLITELLNSSLETIANNISQEWHPVVKRVKDIASAAVFVSFILSIITWILILS